LGNSEPKVIEVTDLHKSYGPVKAVNGISFNVEKGEVFGMLGPNGAGKTTTVEIIEGLRDADKGKVSVLGMDVARVPKRVKQEIGVQLQAPAMLPRLNVGEILGLFASFYPRSLPVDEVLEILALTESKKVLVRNLSGGQQQRLSVAAALISDPEIAFLDEPTTGLDPQARRDLWTVIENMSQRGKTVFLTTHYMEEAERLCDRVAIIDHGDIIAMASPRDLIAGFDQEKAIQFDMTPPPDEDALRALAGVTSVAIDSEDVIVYSDNIPETMSALLRFMEDAGLTARIGDLHVRQATLEDVFLKRTGRKILE